MSKVNLTTADLNQLYQQAAQNTQSSNPATQQQAQKLTAEAMYAYAAQNPGATVSQAASAVSTGEQKAGVSAATAAKLTGNVVTNMLPTGDDPTTTAVSATHHRGNAGGGGKAKGGGGGGGGGSSSTTEQVLEPTTGQYITRTVQN